MLGFLAAHFRGWLERAVLTLADFQPAMPCLIPALSLLALFGNPLPLLVRLIGPCGWEGCARVARGLAISAARQRHATAVTQLGASPPPVCLRHVLPNIAASLLASMTLIFPEVILVEAGLSFLGLGMQPPMTSLGNMVGYGRDPITRASWIMLSPAVVIVLTALAVSMFENSLRGRLDPTLGFKWPQPMPMPMPMPASPDRRHRHPLHDGAPARRPRCGAEPGRTQTGPH